MIRARLATPDDARSVGSLLENAAGAVAALPAARPADLEASSGLRLVAEDLRTQRLIATARLEARTGLVLPRYAYHVGCAVHASAELGLFQRQRTLLLNNDHTGASELLDIAASAAEQSLGLRAAAMRLLVQTALLLVASDRAAHDERLVVTLPGVRDGTGRSPFWQGFGAHFHRADVEDVARQHGPAWKSHVAALLPRQPIYTSFLPAPAQAAVAQAHAATRWLVELLQEEGLRYGHHIDIHDAGPILEVALDDMPGVSTSRVYRVEKVDVLPPGATARTVLRLDGPVGAVRVRAFPAGGALQVGSDEAASHGLVDGCPVRAAS